MKRNDVVMVLEAMKMELPIRSPRDGVVKAIRCEAGELVQPGTTLLELEDDPRPFESLRVVPSNAEGEKIER